VEILLPAIVRGIGIGSVYALLAVSFVVIYRATEVVNFAQPALMILGAFFTSLFVVRIGLPFPVGVIAAMVVMAGVGALTERVAMRPLVGQPVFSAAMVTVGVYIVLTMVASRLIGPDILTVGHPWGVDRIEVGGYRFARVDLAKTLIALGAIALVGLLLGRSRIGLAMRATSLDQETALAQGVNVGRMFSIAWAMSAALAALAGMLISTGVGGIEAISALVALKALPVIILGGLDSIKGSVVAGLIIGVAEALTAAYQSAYAPWLGANFEVVVPYVILIVSLMVRPYGLYGTPEVQRV
jgi:branched-chain amino acid transport system permease protein